MCGAGADTDFCIHTGFYAGARAAPVLEEETAVLSSGFVWWLEGSVLPPPLLASVPIGT